MTATELATYFAIVCRNYGFADQVSLEEINNTLREHCRGLRNSPTEEMFVMLRRICSQRDNQRMSTLVLRHTRAILQRLEDLGVSRNDIIRRLSNGEAKPRSATATGSP